jgi:hypothetical protein
VLLYLSKETTVRELAANLDVSVRQAQRYVGKLLELGLIADRQHIKLVDNWEEVWDSLPEKMGTAGKKEAAQQKLYQSRVARKRLRLLREGKAVASEGCVVTHDGEII